MIALRSMFRVDPLAPRVGRPLGVSMIAAGFMAFALLLTAKVLWPLASGLVSLAFGLHDQPISFDEWISMIPAAAISILFLTPFYAYAIWIWLGNDTGRSVALALAWLSAAVGLIALSSAMLTWWSERSTVWIQVGSTSFALAIFSISLATLIYLHRPKVRAYFSTLEAARRRIAARKMLTPRHNERVDA